MCSFWTLNQYVLYFEMEESEHLESSEPEVVYIRIRGVSKNLKSDLEKVAEKRAYPTLSSFLKSELRKIANTHLTELKIKPSGD